MTTTPRTLISVMQVTVDGYIQDPKGESDWVDSWADGLELLPPVDAFVLGGGMISGYEQFWAAILHGRGAASGMLGREPYAREVDYALVAADTPHLVLSTTRTATSWPSARIVRDIGEIHTLKAQPGNPVYVVGGPGLVASFVQARLLDEIHLIVHPVIAGGGTALFDGTAERQTLELVSAKPMASGRVHLAYRLGAEGQAR
jgi:dihydrofolate reductase